MREDVGGLEPYTVHVLPADAPWRASCGLIGLEVTIANFRKDLADVALDERQCTELLLAVGRAMLSLTDNRPATKEGAAHD